MVDLAWRVAPTESELTEFLVAVRDADGHPTPDPGVELPQRFKDGDQLTATEGGRLVGYAHLNPPSGHADGRVGELYVRPDARRRGVGTMLVTGLLDRVGVDQERESLRLWAFGDHPAAARLAERHGFRRARTLWRMRRSLRGGVPDPRLPAGLRLRTFEPGQDEPAVVEVNRRAFAWHPEQGRMTVAELRAVQGRPWFDAGGFLLAVDAENTLLGFHWTKVHPDIGGEPMGEVYVLAVDPGAQGRGVGQALTLAGLRHLADSGLATAVLYVEADNTTAIATYRKLGFAVWDADVQYAR